MEIVSLADDMKQQIIELFRLCFEPRKLEISYYNWRFIGHPSNKVFVNIFVDDSGKIVSHYGASPAISSYLGQEFLSALSMTTMTHPSYTGKGLFPRLAEHLYCQMKDIDGVAFIYGFPNINSHYSFTTKLKWCDVYLLPTLKRQIEPQHLIASFSGLEQPFNAAKFDALWHRVKYQSDRFFPNARNASFLRWRFIECPTKRYSILNWRDGDEITAYAILKPFDNNGVMDLDVIDILSDKRLEISQVMLGVLQYGAQNGFKNVNSWLPLGSEYYRSAEKIGFKPTCPVTYLAYRQLREGVGLPDLNKAVNWHVTMADSDVY